MTQENDFEAVVTQRHSVRQYVDTKPIAQEKMAAILKMAFLAPSALNQQPIRAIVISKADLRRKLAPGMTPNESQLKTAGALVLLVGDRENLADEKPFAPATQQVAGPTTTTALDAGLVGMQLMLAAKHFGFDSNPMTGFDHQIFSQVLGLDEQRYDPLLLIALGTGQDHGSQSSRKSLDNLVDYR